MNPTQGVISEAWDLYKRHFAHFATIAFIVYLAVAIVQALLTALLGLFGALVALILSAVALFWVYGALTEAVSDVVDGRADLSVGETFDRTRPMIGPIAGAGLLAGIAIGIGLILLIVPGLFLMTIWCLIVPAIVLENKGVFDSFGRSRQLVSGYGWNVFGVAAVAFLIYFVFEIVLGLVLAPLPSAVGSFLYNVIAGTLAAPFIAGVLTLLYFRLRHAKEGGTAAPPASDVTGPPAGPTPGNV